VVSKRSNGRRESRRRASEHTYRDKEQAEEDRALALCPLFLAWRGRVVADDSMHRG
jgi:hypothetical protein